jgi:hypothetical protein
MGGLLLSCLLVLDASILLLPAATSLPLRLWSLLLLLGVVDVVVGAALVVWLADAAAVAAAASPSKDMSVSRCT